ncbi:MAG: flagellar motor protein MotB, partial [Xanthomonadaceae bacterium]|nr:flagellar motor protein MotB [Xanthomonadaceae bacterium]
MSAKGELPPIIIVKKKVAGHGHHGGAWKVAYADFVTAMMAFFMVMWLVVTQPQEVLGGIADYFKSPSMVDGQASKMVPGGMRPGGAGEKMVRIFDEASTKSGETDQEKKRDLSAEELRKAAEEADRKRLESLMEELQAAIEASQSLAPFKDQLLIDITPEGLRVQIVDRQNRPMFDSGSFRLQSYTAEILDELAEYLDTVPNRIALTGHTDVTPFGNGDAGYTNWELSADRANAARRALISGGLRDDKFARVVGLSSTALFDKANPENPINRRISIILLNQAAEEQAREMDEYDIDGPPAPAADADAAGAAGDAASPADAAAQAGDGAAPDGGARPG